MLGLRDSTQASLVVVHRLRHCAAMCNLNSPTRDRTRDPCALHWKVDS